MKELSVRRDRYTHRTAGRCDVKMIEAFTGPTDLDPEQRWFVAETLATGEWGRTWRSGCAYGVDTLVARFARMMEFDVNLELFVPAANHNRKMVEELSPHARVARLALIEGASIADLYRQRNTWMVAGSPHRALFGPASHLTAFVKSTKFYRSGEWMTVNIARNFKIPVTLKELPA